MKQVAARDYRQTGSIGPSVFFADLNGKLLSDERYRVSTRRTGLLRSCKLDGHQFCTATNLRANDAEPDRNVEDPQASGYGGKYSEGGLPQNLWVEDKE